MLSAMQFKSFVWPHNPTHYNVSFARRTAIHKPPYGVCSVEDLGESYRVMEGSGEFYGKDAYAHFRNLSAVFAEGTPGILIHPLWQGVFALFTELELLEEPGENYVRYRFRFLQCPQSEQRSAVRSETTAGEGESLWSIAARSGVNVQTLLALNPTLSSANALRAGSRVKLR